MQFFFQAPEAAMSGVVHYGMLPLSSLISDNINANSLISLTVNGLK